jgi:hypothetical protein
MNSKLQAIQGLKLAAFFEPIGWIGIALMSFVLIALASWITILALRKIVSPINVLVTPIPITLCMFFLGNVYMEMLLRQYILQSTDYLSLHSLPPFGVFIGCVLIVVIPVICWLLLRTEYGNKRIRVRDLIAPGSQI